MNKCEYWAPIGNRSFIAITRDRKLFDMVSQTVRIAAEILDVE